MTQRYAHLAFDNVKATSTSIFDLPKGKLYE